MTTQILLSEVRPVTHPVAHKTNIPGVVRLTKEGEVRWTTWSIFNGQERWRSEGIQVGGVRSARGVIGNWFERYLSHPIIIIILTV